MPFNKNSSLMKKIQGVLGILFSILIIFSQGCQRAPKIISTATGVSSPLVVTTDSAIKIITDEAGIYMVTAKELANSGVQGWLENVDQLHLYNRGIEQPFWTEGQGADAFLTFYGAASDSIYTSENVYWLSYGDQISKKLSWTGKENAEANQGEMVTDIGQPELMASIPQDGYLARKHFEENKVYAPLVEDGDHWFWDKVSGKQKKVFPIMLDEVLTGKGILRIDIWSATQADASPDHHLMASINGQAVIDEKWDGSGKQLLEAEIPDGVLKDGENSVEVFIPTDLGVRAETNHINWIEIEYPRRFNAVDDRIEFKATKTSISISGLSKDVAVYDINSLKNIIQKVNQGEVTNDTFSFEGELGRQYLVVGSKGYLQATSIEIAQMTPDLREGSQGVDWVAIGPQDLLDALKPLVDWREKNGLSTKIIPDQIIYDQFGNGFPEPEAIRRFVMYAMQNWKPAPQYLVLVGDASYDPKGYLGNMQANRLPSFLIQTGSSGETASDVKFIDSEDNPDKESLVNLAIGRIPAQTEKQVETLVQKIIKYESTQSTDQDASVLAVADGQDASFAEAAKSFLGLFTSGYKTTLLAPAAGASDIPKQVVENIKQNDFIVAYFGHGSIDMWGKDMLFSTDNVKELSNLKHYPIIMNFTCLTGLFSHPSQESLAETLLWQPDGGAVLVIAPTSLTLASDQSSLSRPLATAIIETPDAAIGPLLQKVRVEMAGMNEGVRDVMNTFLLFGDPATRLMRP